MTCGRVSPLSTQSTFEDLAVDFEGTTASGAERFYRRTLDKLRLKLLERGLVHTVGAVKIYAQIYLQAPAE